MDDLLIAKQVRVEFGPLVAVRDVSFEIAGGELIGLVGPNGAGKTTLLRVLAGLHAPTSGSAHVLGRPVLGEHEVVRHHIGFAPDTPPVYEEITIRQFLEFIAGAYRLGRAEASERIDFWLEKLWLVEKRDTPIKHLSRGMRQRLTLARTLIPRPHVLLLDEPLAGLDPAGRVHLRAVLAMLREQGCAMVVSSHILADLEQVATHIAIIEQGSILQWSRTEALQHRDTRKRKYRLGVLEVTSDHVAILSGLDGVSDVEADGDVYTFDFHAGSRDAADLLRRLVESGLPVTSFTVVKTTLEDVYLSSGVREVD
jgi:ABC-2 type transport system ATP-binding protein